MSTKHLLLEELHPIVDNFPSLQFRDDGMAKLREILSANVEIGDPERAGVIREEIYAPVSDGTQVRCLVYRPQQQTGQVPGYLHIHGGGYIIGSVEGSDLMNLMLCAKLGIVIVSVDYRLAPEHPIPAPLEDCYGGLAWLVSQAQELQVDTARIGVGGESAGGGLAAALAIYARDKSEYKICHQHLTYPMLDDRTGTDEQPGDPLTGEFVWTRESNQYGWNSYLRDAPRAAPQVPARVEDVAGLPNTWMFTATMDLFRDENIEYAQRLMAAGIHTELVVYPGACHGFQNLPNTQIGERFVNDHREALARGLGV